MKKDTQKFNLYNLRRKDLLSSVRDIYGTQSENSVLIFFASFETERVRFRQDSSFYYLTGLQEPGLVLTLTLQGQSTLWVPNCTPARAQWVDTPVAFEQKNAKHFLVDTIQFLGSTCTGYQFHPFFPAQEYDQLTAFLQKTSADGGKIFTLSPENAHGYIEQRLILERLTKFIPQLPNAIIDISPVVHAMRRRKDVQEIELTFKAIDITCMAHHAAAQAIKPGMSEAEVQATIEYIFTGSSARTAFPSIVATGKNATVLHYMSSVSKLAKDELVVIDIGAEYDYYCADLTRTYPVSGTFTARQKELYQIVLDTQEYIAQKAKPGIWLNNKNKPEQSLNHLAKEYLALKGYEKYFVHGIGHFLGMDVHDVGDYSQPLQEGDVFTIEPGIYIPEEKIGIRIEDNYWVVKESVMCLSEQLPKSIKDIEELVQQTFED